MHCFIDFYSYTIIYIDFRLKFLEYVIICIILFYVNISIYIEYFYMIYMCVPKVSSNGFGYIKVYMYLVRIHTCYMWYMIKYLLKEIKNKCWYKSIYLHLFKNLFFILNYPHYHTTDLLKLFYQHLFKNFFSFPHYPHYLRLLKIYISTFFREFVFCLFIKFELNSLRWCDIKVIFYISYFVTGFFPRRPIFFRSKFFI